MLREYHGYARREFLRVLDVQEFIRSMGVGMRPKYARDEELRAGKLPAQHAHERNRATATRVHGLASVYGARGQVDRLRQPRREWRCVPAAGGRVRFERHRR